MPLTAPRRAVAAACALLAALSLPVLTLRGAPVPVFVKADAVGANDGTSWADAYTSLQAAMEAVSAPALVYVAKGTYLPESYNGLDAGDPADERLRHFRLANGVALYGGFAGNEDVFTFDLAERDFTLNETILSGNIGAPLAVTDNCYHVIYHYYSDIPEYAEHVNLAAPLDATAVLDGFTVRDAQSEFWGPHGDGGGMHNTQASPTVRNCRFIDNVAARYGGGMYNFGSGPVLADCRFEDNVAGVSGGAVNNYNSPAQFTRTVFMGNVANSDNPASGGAMANFVGSHVTLTACEFRGNYAKEYGGAVYNWNTSSPTFHDCLFAGNLADTYGGGAIANVQGCHPVLRGCTLADNSAPGFAGNGGAMFSWNGSNPVCYSSIFWGNQATSHDEIYNHTTLDPSVPDFRHCDIAGSGGSGPGWDALLGTDSGGNLDEEPVFVDVGNGNYRLHSSSLCIDAGDNLSTLTTTDLDGFARIVDGNGDLTPTVDIGAYEYQTVVLTMAIDPPAAAGSTGPSLGPHVVGVGEPVSIWVMPKPGYHFLGWSAVGPAEIAAPAVISTSVTVTAPQPVTVTANYVESTLLTFAANPADKGTTTPPPGPRSVPVGLPVDIAATPVTGWHFAEWTIDAGNAVLADPLAAATAITVADTGGASVTAQFEINTYAVTFATDGTPGATLDGNLSQTVAHGADGSVVTAQAPAGSVFLYWILDGAACSASPALQPQGVTRDLHFVANFAPAGTTARLTLAATPGGTTLPAPGPLTVAVGEGLGIAALADPGFEFFGWEVTAGNAVLGDALSAATAVTVTGAAGTTVQARFGQYARLTLRAEPEGSATFAPAAEITVVVGEGVDISATGNFGFGFQGWESCDDVTIASTMTAATVVTVNTTSGASLTANFAEFDRMAFGSVLEVAAADVWLPGGFTAKPKVYGLYDHPFNGKVGLKAAAKVLTKVVAEGTPAVDAEWTRKIRLYDAKALKADQKTGESAADWLGDPAHQHELEVAIHVAGKELDPDDQPLVAMILATPQIITPTFSPGGDMLTLEGFWFGSKGLKAWREYTVQATGEVKRQVMKVLKPTEADAAAGFADTVKGKPAFMNPRTGESKAVLLIPAKLPKGDLNGIVVIDNGVGIAVIALPDAP